MAITRVRCRRLMQCVRSSIPFSRSCSPPQPDPPVPSNVSHKLDTPQHECSEEAGERRRHRQDWRHALLAVAQRQGLVREPQIALHLLTRLVHQAIRRVRRHILGTDRGDLVAEHRCRPAHPLRQRRRGHPRRRGQQHPHLRRIRVKTRARRGPLVLRLSVRF